MKRILTLATAILMAITLSVTAFAYKPVSTNELTTITSLPDQSHMISVGLTSSSSKTDAADIGDLNYGLSVIGFSKFNSTVAAISDGLWASSPGNWEVDGTTYYNVNGETGKDDSIYKSLVTYNFGKKMDFEAFGYFSNGVVAYLGAVDLYVSDNGTDWTLVGYYDNIEKTQNGETNYDSSTIIDPADANGANLDAAKRGCPFWSLEGFSGQYLRVAVTSCNQLTSSAGETYETKSNNVCFFREMAVYGVEHTASNDGDSSGDNNQENPGTSDTVCASVMLAAAAAVVLISVKKRNRA